MPDVEIGWARKEEWNDTMAMVWRTFLRFEGKIYPENGVGEFFNFITDERLLQGFMAGNYQVMVARHGDEIVGMGSLRNGNFLSLLFVDAEYQKQHIGSRILEKLMEYLKYEAGEKNMLVKAATGAETFYTGRGFKITGKKEEYNGISVTPMKIRL